MKKSEVYCGSSEWGKQGKGTEVSSRGKPEQRELQEEATREVTDNTVIMITQLLVENTRADGEELKEDLKK